MAVRTRTAPFGAAVLVSLVVLFTPGAGVSSVRPGVDTVTDRIAARRG